MDLGDMMVGKKGCGWVMIGEEVAVVVVSVEDGCARGSRRLQIKPS